jgi:hypothetical protein
MAPGARKMRAELHPHPGAPCDTVRRVTVEICRTPGALAVTYDIQADMARLVVPAAKRHGGRQDRLWEHTCCEIFIAGALPAYHEFNFAPSGTWAVYSFREYRKAMPCADEALDPGISVRLSADRMELGASIPLNLLAHDDGLKLVIAASAVIESEHGVLSYWALKHPRARPDFHHPESFALELDAVRH